MAIQDSYAALPGAPHDPAFTFIQEPNTGMFLESPGVLAWVVRGLVTFRMRAGDVPPDFFNPYTALTGFGVYNVKNYGALGNGSANDTSAIQATLDVIATGGTIFFPGPGTYMINAPLRYRSNQVWHFGAGAKLKLMNTSVASLITTDLGVTATGMLQPFTLTVSNVVFFDMEIDGNKDNNPTTNAGDGLDIFTGTNITLFNPYIHDVSRDGISIGHTSASIFIYGARCLDNGLSGVNGGNGIAITKASNVCITDFNCSGNGLHGIDLEGNAGDPADGILNIRISNGRADNNDRVSTGSAGITCYATVNANIRDVSVTNVRAFNNYRGFALYGSSTNISYDVRFVACTAYRNDREGFYSNSCEQISFTNCVATENGQELANTYSGFRIHRVHQRLIGCVANDGQATSTQNYGFEEVTNSNHNVFIGCFATGNDGGAYNRIGAASIWVNAVDPFYISNGFNVGGGTTITKHFSGTTALVLGTINAQTVATADITVTGAEPGDQVYATPTSGTPGANLVWSATMTASNTATVRVANCTSGNIVTTNRTWRADAWRH